ELAIAAPPGGKGTLWIADLCLEDQSFRATPAVQASSALPAHEPRCAVDRRVETSWQSEPSDEPQWFLIDFGEAREYGGLIIRWDATTTARPFDLESSDDGTAWTTVYSAKRPDAARSYVYVPHGMSRRLRLRLHRGADGSPTQELEEEFLPIPSSVWRKDGIALKATAFATGEVGKAVLYIRYRLENLDTAPRQVRFFTALRPFQVTPPWQAFNDLGGVSGITTLEYLRGAVWVNRRKAVIPLTA